MESASDFVSGMQCHCGSRTRWAIVCATQSCGFAVFPSHTTAPTLGQTQNNQFRGVDTLGSHNHVGNRIDFSMLFNNSAPVVFDQRRVLNFVVLKDNSIPFTLRPHQGSVQKQHIRSSFVSRIKLLFRRPIRRSSFDSLNFNFNFRRS